MCSFEATEYFHAYEGTSAGLLTRVRHNRSGGSDSVYYAYDGNARMVSMRDWLGWYHMEYKVFGYDGAGRLTTITDKRQQCARTACIGDAREVLTYDPGPPVR